MRPIDAKALEIKTQKIKAEALEHGFAPESVCGDILLNFLDNAPTIEAKPVVRAHWESNQCSNCKGFALSFDNEPYRMDEVVSDNNVGSKTEGEKIPVISMEDVPKLMREGD